MNCDCLSRSSHPRSRGALARLPDLLGSMTPTPDPYHQRAQGSLLRVLGWLLIALVMGAVALMIE